MNNTPTDQLYLDLFTTALESGIGYWSYCNSYHWCIDGDTGRSDFAGFKAEITDLEDDEQVADHIIDRTVIARGYRRAVSADWRDRLAWSTAKPPVVLTEESVDDWDFDASDADMIVQLGLFNDVRYS